MQHSLLQNVSMFLCVYEHNITWQTPEILTQCQARVPLHELYSNAIKKQEASVHVIIERTQVNKNQDGCRNPRPCFLLYNFLEHISLIIRHSEFKFDGNSYNAIQYNTISFVFSQFQSTNNISWWAAIVRLRCRCNSIRGYKIATFFHPVQISSNYLIIFWIGRKMSFHWILIVLETLLMK